MSEPTAVAAHAVEDGIATLWLDRPPRNVLDIATMKALLEAIAALARTPALRALVVRSRLDVFSAGVDVKEHRDDLVRPMLATFHRLLEALLRFEAPTVAVVGGSALGGGLEVALACDLRVVAADARLALPEIVLGVFPPFAAVRLPELTGMGAAARLMFTGEPITGERAHQIGLADVVAPKAELDQAAQTLLASLAAKSASSLRYTKEALRESSAARRSRLDRIEALYLDKLMATHDADEGLRSFLEKRPPAWQHR